MNNYESSGRASGFVLICSCLHSQEVWSAVTSRLEPEDFVIPEHIAFMRAVSDKVWRYGYSSLNRDVLLSISEDVGLHALSFGFDIEADALKLYIDDVQEFSERHAFKSLLDTVKDLLLNTNIEVSYLRDVLVNEIRALSIESQRMTNGNKGVKYV